MFILNLGIRGNDNGLVIRIRGRGFGVSYSSMKTSVVGLSMTGWYGGVGAKDMLSRKAWASGMVRVKEVGVEKSEYERWVSVSEGLGVVLEEVQVFKVGGEMVVMVFDSSSVILGMEKVTEMDGLDMVIVSETLEDLGGGMALVPKVIYGDGEV